MVGERVVSRPVDGTRISWRTITFATMNYYPRSVWNRLSAGMEACFRGTLFESSVAVDAVLGGCDGFILVPQYFATK